MDLTQQILWHLQRLPARDQERVLDFVESLALPDASPSMPVGFVHSADTTSKLGLSHPHDPAWEADCDDCL